MNDEQKIHDEETAARIFLTWLRGLQDVEWTFTRAEEKFPELDNRTRRDIVSHRADSNDKWMALEVKSLVFTVLFAWLA